MSLCNPALCNPAFVLLLLAASCSSTPSRLGPGPDEPLYDQLCSSCHGQDGTARTDLAKDLDPGPRDLSRCSFKYRSTPTGSLPTDNDLLRTMFVGLPGTVMPSFSRLIPLAGLRDLVLQVKRRCRRFDKEKPDPPLASPGHELFTQDSAARGRKIYRRESCHSCHGDQGRGDGPAGKVLRDASGRPIQPRDYTRGTFRSGFGRVDIYRAFSTGLDSTPMPALPETVSRQDRWDLTHYIVSLSHKKSRLWRALETRPTWYEPAYGWRLPWQ